MSRLPRTKQVSRLAAQAGLTLVELMIALVLGLVIMLVLTSMYADISRTNQEMAKTNSQIENARFAMQLLAGDVMHGGYWVGYVPDFDDLTAIAAPTEAPTVLPDPCLDSASWDADYFEGLFGIAVQAYNSASAAGTCSGTLPNPQANTDVLVVRHAETCVPGIGNCAALSTGNLYFQVSNCLAEIEDGDKYGLHHYNGTDFSNFTLHNRGVADTSSVCNGALATPGVQTSVSPRRFVSNIYYIRDFAVTAGDGIPTLMRSTLANSGGSEAHQAPVPLVEGIQGFRVEMGVDSVGDGGTDVISAGTWDDLVAWQDEDYKDEPTNRGDGSPDGDFVHCTTAGASPCELAKLANVVAVKIYLLARADSTTPGYTDTKTYTLGGQTLGPFNDGYKRHVFSNTVRLVNVSARRETP